MKRILITGVSGFIGSSLKGFIEDNLPRYKTYGIDAYLSSSTKNCFKGDIKDKIFLRDVIKDIRPHYVFHLAGLTDKNDLDKLISINVLATSQLLETISNIKNLKTRIIIPGSAAEYGDVSGEDMPVKEDCALRPINFYGLSKACQVLLSLSYASRGLEVIVGRIFNISGWAMPRSFSAGEFARSISLIEKGVKKPIIETMGLDSERDYLDIRDVCSGLMAVAEKGRPGNIYNICSGKSHKTRYVLDCLVKLSGVKGIRIDERPSARSEIKSIVGCNEKLKRYTGWNPEVSIRESLKNTLSYYRQDCLER